MSKPKNWPEQMPYLTSPLHSKDLTPSQRQTLRTRPSSSFPTIPPSAAAQTPSPLVKIQRIQTPATHPARGQHGLFAARALAPGQFILPYLGRTHGWAATDHGSDYDLWLDHEAGVAVDAGREGNEGRFVNDFRGVRARANAEFGTGWCERWGEVCVGFWVIGGGGGGGGEKGKGKGTGGIKKGEEIVVSYGKGFWEKRAAESEADGDAGGG